MALGRSRWKGLSGRRVSRIRCTVAACPIRMVRTYNVAMDKPHASQRRVRRTAWWVAFAALAGFLLADLT